MPSDYQKQIKEIFGTSDLDELRELAKMLKINHPNPRNAGRKAQLTPDQTVEVLELHRKGIGITEIAKQFGVSRQTIYKYIYNAEHFSKNPDFLQRQTPAKGFGRCSSSCGQLRGVFERKMPARQPSRSEWYPPGDGCPFL